MFARLRPHLSYANVVSTVCLFVLLGGSAYAAVTLKRGSVKGKHIAKNAITAPKVKNRSLRAADLARGVVQLGVEKVVVRRRNVDLPSGPNNNAPGETQRVQIGCAAGEKLIGGTAYSINTSGEVLSSRPTTDETGAAVPEEGATFTHWSASGRALSDNPGHMRAFAFCAQAP